MTKRLLLRFQRPLLFTLCSMPFALMAGQIWMPDSPILWWLFPGMQLLFSLAFLLLKGKARLVTGLFGAISIIAVGFFLLSWQAAPQMLLLPVVYAVMTLVAVPICARPAHEELQPWAIIVGLVLYLPAQFVVSRVPDTWRPIGHLLLVCFLAFLLLTLLMMNRLSLQNAMLNQQPPPKVLKRFGTLLTIGTFVIVLLIASIPAIGHALSAAWQFITDALRKVIAFLTSLMPINESASGISGGSAPDFAELGETPPPSPLAIFLEKVMMVIAFLILIVLVVFLLRKIYQVIRRLIDRLIRQLRAYTESSTADYVDETIDTREDAETRKASTRKAFNRISAASISKLPPRERIRAIYARMMHKHLDWLPSSTARDHLSDEAAQLYERARYSDHDVTASDADAFQQHTNRTH